jgi:uncharacterized membrane protein
MKRGWPIIGALVGGLIAFAIAWALAGDDTQRLGDWRGGAERFIGFVSALGVGIGYIATRQLTESDDPARSLARESTAARANALSCRTAARFCVVSRHSPVAHHRRTACEDGRHDDDQGNRSACRR